MYNTLHYTNNLHFQHFRSKMTCHDNSKIAILSLNHNPTIFIEYILDEFLKNVLFNRKL